MSLFRMPSLGADMESAVLVEWKVDVGDEVKKGQVIAEIEASKGIIEIEVFEDGVVEKFLVEEETECAVGTPMAVIRTSDEAEVAIDDAKPKELKPKIEPQEAIEVETKEKIIQHADDTTVQTSTRIKASPAARKRAKELGVDLAIAAKTATGFIKLEDVEKAASVASREVSEKKPKTKDEKTGSDHSMRQAIAAAMSKANSEIPHYYLSTSINMSAALNRLEERNRTHSIKERILPAALLIHAAVQILKEVPELNGFWRNGKHEISDSINPGFAIALRKCGLLTPAILNAQDMDLVQTMQSMGDLIQRTRASKLRGSELSEQTITITNLGDLGVETVFGVIYPPQVALIGFGKITDSPWAEGDSLSVRKVMQATLAGDHRATDGRTGATYLSKLKNYLEHPEEWK